MQIVIIGSLKEIEKAAGVLVQLAERHKMATRPSTKLATITSGRSVLIAGEKIEDDRVNSIMA